MKCPSNLHITKVQVIADATESHISPRIPYKTEQKVTVTEKQEHYSYTVKYKLFHEHGFECIIQH